MRIDKAFIISSGDESKMESALPCALHSVCGKQAVRWVYEALRPADEVIIACQSPEIFRASGAPGEIVGLDCPLGTEGYALIVRANMPLLSSATAELLSEAAQGCAAAYLHIQEDEIGRDLYDVCCVRGDLLDGHTANDDIAELVRTLEKAGEKVVSCSVVRYEHPRITDRKTLWECTFMAQAMINARHMNRGVTLIDPTHTYISDDTVIGRDTVIYPNTMLMGRCAIGEGCEIFDSRLTDTAVGDGCILKNVVAEQAAVGSGVKIGPFVNLRPDTVIADGCKVGDFVEIKNSNIGRGTKLPHLTYVGDADVGERVNVGCGSVFVNYDGMEKHRTTVGNDVFIGCQSNLVAPVKVANGAYTAAGSTITEDVPEDSLAIARARQENKIGWVKKYYALRGRKHRS